MTTRTMTSEQIDAHRALASLAEVVASQLNSPSVARLLLLRVSESYQALGLPPIPFGEIDAVAEKAAARRTQSAAV